MSEQKALYYNELLKKYQKIENQINAVPQLSIEEQSAIVDINQKYNPQNQEKVDKLRGMLLELEQQLKSIM
jgi:polyhydroxyalkanoate synthesis regulator phasin|tara:strand:- start:267 stop:479 length:213 start_codon:yes stop_codon:yes gene_type:complete